jgi:hypothetical protein
MWGFSGRPYTNRSRGAQQPGNREYGYSNMLGPWKTQFLASLELENVNFSSDEKMENILRIPYSSTPSMNEYYRLSMPLNFIEREMLHKRFGSICTLSPDWSLDLEFQNHVLRRQDNSDTRLNGTTLDLLKNHYRALHTIGGSFQVVDMLKCYL